MGFFDDFGKKVTNTTMSFQETTNKIERQNKCKRQITENNSKIEKCYNEIGKKVYQSDKIDKEVSSFIDEKKNEINKLVDENKSLHLEILKLDNKAICTNCESEIDANASFCPNCGKEQNIVPEGKIRCKKCGEIIDKNYAFCLKCGAKNTELSDDIAKVVEVDEMAEADEQKKLEE